MGTPKHLCIPYLSFFLPTPFSRARPRQEPKNPPLPPSPHHYPTCQKTSAQLTLIIRAQSKSPGQPSGSWSSGTLSRMWVTHRASPAGTELLEYQTLPSSSSTSSDWTCSEANSHGWHELFLSDQNASLVPHIIVSLLSEEY